MELKIGLEGVAVAETAIASVNGQKGRLIYRGNRIEDVVAQHDYESVVFLILKGHIPSAKEKETFSDCLKAERHIPDSVKAILTALPKDLPVMQAIRTAVSALVVSGSSWPPTEKQAIEIFAKIPTIITFFHHVSNGTTPIEPDMSLSHAGNYLYMLHGDKPTQAHIEALETYLSVSIEHGMNASTFTARVVSATEENLVGALTAAMAALEGPLHGGAPSKVDDMLEAIGSQDLAAQWLREKIESGERLMGFGHRVYKTYDPRAAILKGVTEKLASDDNPLFQLALHVESSAIALLAEYKPGRNLYPNLEFWTAGVLRTVNLPRSLYTPTFCLSRVAGWSAHVLEQSEHNRLIRPGSIYTGIDPYEIT